MVTYAVRLWLPDRPGALGQVASRIGAVRGDVVGIDILERGAGRAIDELLVALPDDQLVHLLVTEIEQVDGVDVEDVRPIPHPDHDARVDALETAARLVETTAEEPLLKGLCVETCEDFDAEWAVVISESTGVVLHEVGRPPEAAWLAAFLAGVRHMPESVAGPHDVAWAALGGSGMDIVLGRSGRPLRDRERRQLAVLARITAVRLRDLADR
jgi:hypothetical protein